MLREILFIGIAVALTLQVIAAKAVQEAKKESPQRFARSLVYDPEIDELFYDDEVIISVVMLSELIIEIIDC